MGGCLIAGFVLLWKITKLVLKLAWKILRVLLFRWGLIFIAAYVLGAFITDKICHIGLSPGGEMQVWYYIGLTLSIICTAVFFIGNAVRNEKRERVRQDGKRPK